MSVDISASKIIDAIKDVVEKAPQDDFLFGTVKKVDPLNIALNDKIVLNEKMLFLGQACRPHKVTIPHTHQFNGVTEKTKAVSGVNQEGKVKHYEKDEDGKEQEKEETVQLGGADVKFSGDGTLTIVEPEGHSHVLNEQYTEDVHKKDTDYEEYVTIDISPALAVGDKVLLFAFNNFKKFYVAERIEDDDSEDDSTGGEP